MITSNLLSDLRGLLPETEIEERGTPNHLLGNDGDIVIYPTSEEEISQILSYANENNKKAVISGMGTKRGYGGVEEAADILLSLTNFKGIVEHTVGDMTVTVKPGTPFKELQEHLAKHDQKIALDPPFSDFATIGGIIAANESGPKRLGYGSARDLVIGLKVVYPNGEVIRTGGKVVKNVAGYDMNKLFIGSMGTLGVLSEITLKLRPIPKHESLVLLSFEESSLENIKQLAVKILDSLIEPVSLQLLNPSAAQELTGKSNYTLAIAFEDVESSVKYQEDFIKNLQPENTSFTLLQEEEAKEFWQKFSNLAPNGIMTITGNETEAALKVGVKNLDVFKVIRECELLEEGFNVKVISHGGLGHG